MTEGPSETIVVLHVQPGASREAWRYDAWRARWILSVRAKPLGGAANRDALAALARALGVPPNAVAWRKAGSSRDKVAIVYTLAPDEVERRLRHASLPAEA